MSSLITQKFQYQSIKRIDKAGKRLYETPQGHAVPSVTTILNATKDKTALIEWRKRVGPKLATEITTEAAGVGTRMHKYLEDYMKLLCHRISIVLLHQHYRCNPYLRV